MAAEIQWRYTATGSTLYATIRTMTGTMWNTGGTPNFESLTVANWSSYKITMTETPASSYFYVGTFPAISGNMVAGWYWVDVYSGSAGISDTLVGTILGYWNGTALKPQATDVIAVAGTTQTARDLGAGVLLSLGTGTGQISLSSGTVTVGTNNDKTGYTASTVSDKTGYSLAASSIVTATYGTCDFTSTMKTSIGTAVAASAVASVTGNVGGNVTGSVGSVTAAVTLPTIPTDWIAASGVKADAVTKMQNGLATPTNITAASGIALSSTQSAYAPAKAGDAMTLTAAYDAAKTAGAGTSTLTTGDIDARLTAYGGSKPGTAQTITANQAVNVAQWNGGALPTIGTSTLDASAVQTACDAALDAYDTTGVAKQSTLADATFGLSALHTDIGSISAGSAPTKEQVAAAVVDQALSGHTSPGTVGQALSAAGGVADPLLNDVPGTYLPGTAGSALGSITGIKAKTDLITSGNFTVTSPVNSTGTILYLNIGDDYDDAHNNQIDFTSADFPDLTVTGTVPSLNIFGGVALSVTGVPVDATTARFELTAAQTATLGAGTQRFSVSVEFADHDTRTYLIGKCVASKVRNLT